ncbi:MAG: hypothetical protein IPO63_09585 [Bacteroidetes bacterium]|nr:hypothetical protein [Bacteroidota bacterium]
MIPRVTNKPAAVILLWEEDELTGYTGGKSKFIGSRTKEMGGKYFGGSWQIANWQIGKLLRQDACATRRTFGLLRG